MNIAMNTETARPSEAVAGLIARFGAWRVAAALAGALAGHLLRSRPRLPDLHHLPDHLRRDLGLPDLPTRRADQIWQRHGAAWQNPGFRM